MWGPRPGGVCAVLLRFRCGASRDDQIPVEPGHGLAKGQAVEHVAPERFAICTSPQLSKPSAQEEGKALAAIVKPVPPAPHGSSSAAGATTAKVNGTAGQQQRQHHLLHGPVVPAPRRATQRQPRARSQTFPANEAQNCNGIARLAACASIGLAVVAAVSPQPAQAAVRARLRAVDLGVRAEGFQMLIEGGDARYNSVHRPVSVVSCRVDNPR